jgi:hypothetical protein
MQTLKRSDDFNKKYLQYFLDCFMTGKFCDLKIQTNLNSYILCHKIVLAAVFPQLKHLLAQVRRFSSAFTFILLIFSYVGSHELQSV